MFLSQILKKVFTKKGVQKENHHPVVKLFEHLDKNNFYIWKSSHDILGYDKNGERFRMHIYDFFLEDEKSYHCCVIENSKNEVLFVSVMENISVIYAKNVGNDKNVKAIVELIKSIHEKTILNNNN